MRGLIFFHQERGVSISITDCQLSSNWYAIRCFSVPSTAIKYARHQASLVFSKLIERYILCSSKYRGSPDNCVFNASAILASSSSRAALCCLVWFRMAIYSCGAKYYFGEKNKKGRIYALRIFGGGTGRRFGSHNRNWISSTISLVS